MPMYGLPPYFPSDTVIDLKKVMYNLPSYHDTPAAGSNHENCNELHFFDPVQSTEQQQMALINQLEQLSEKLNVVLSAAGKLKTEEKTQKQGKQQNNMTTPNKENTMPAQQGGNKKDKNAKKEARKENRMKAVAESGASIPNKKEHVVYEKQWVIKEEKQSVETGQSLTACSPQFLVCFEVFAAGNVDLIVTQDDLSWVQNLAKVGGSRNVAFEGKINNGVKNAKTTIKVTVANTVSLSSKDGKVSGRITVWKVLGSVLGLFSFSSDHAIHAAHSHNWLKEVDAVISNQQFKDQLLRSSSQFLSRFDSLSGQFHVSLADIIAFSVLSTLSYFPNNVEMWAGRVKKTIT